MSAGRLTRIWVAVSRALLVLWLLVEIVRRLRELTAAILAIRDATRPDRLARPPEPDLPPQD